MASWPERSIAPTLRTFLFAIFGFCLLSSNLADGSLHAQDPAATPAAEGTAPPAETPATPESPPADAVAAPAEGEVTATSAAPSIEDRLAAIEAYVNNGDPKGILAVPGPGHNGFIMVCAALVLFMTLPGLSLFYGGLVRKKNVLSVVAQCFGCAGLVTILWVTVGYTMVFGEGGSPYLGSFKHVMLQGVGAAPDTNYCYWVSETVFVCFQLMFAIITPALIVGAIAERMKYSAIMLFITLWMFAVYFPLAHMVWGVDGLMNGVWNGSAKILSIDFAGGTVVHMSSGWSALVLCLILGPRLGFGKSPMPPHSMVLCSIGTGMLWVGWYGFNAGSALAADGVSANAFLTTTIAAAIASFVWPLIEYIRNGKPSILGFCSGAVAGLVVVTPACGFIDVTGAVIIGVLAGIVPYVFCTLVKRAFKYDDALDTFGVHAVGGTLGALLTGFLATSDVNANLIGSYATDNGLKAALEGGTLWIEQLKAMGLTIVLSVVATVVIAFIVKATIGLRPTAEVESNGLDLAEHGEAGYEI
jgi:Amt family ammonium transporter